MRRRFTAAAADAAGAGRRASNCGNGKATGPRDACTAGAGELEVLQVAANGEGDVDVWRAREQVVFEGEAEAEAVAQVAQEDAALALLPLSGLLEEDAVE